MLGLGDCFCWHFLAIVGTRASHFLTGITPEESLPSLPHGSPAMFGQKVDMACRSPWWSKSNKITIYRMSKAQRCAFDLLSHVESTSRPGLPLLQPDNHGQPHERRFFPWRKLQVLTWTATSGPARPRCSAFAWCLCWVGIPNDVGGVWTPMVGKQADKPLTATDRSTVALRIRPCKLGSGSELTGVVRADLTERQSKHLWPMSNHSVPRLENQSVYHFGAKETCTEK